MAVLFTIVFTPEGGDPMTLGDVAAKHTAVIHSWGGMAVEEVAHMFEQAAPKRMMLGNVAGEFSFTSELEQESRGAMLRYFMAHRALINSVGTLVVTIDDVVATMLQVTFRGVEPVEMSGVRWPLKYTMGITLIEAEAVD